MKKGTQTKPAQKRVKRAKPAKSKGPTQRDAVAGGLAIAFATGMFKKNGW